MSDYRANRTAALLVFGEHVTEKQIEKALATLEHLLEREPRVEDYDNRYADPVLYFP